MAKTAKPLEMIAGAGVEAQALTTRMLAMQADAGLTIALRMPMLVKGALGDRRGQTEAVKAVTEKVTAVMESGFAAGHATAMFWWGVVFNPLAQVDLHEATAKVVNHSLEPFSKRAQANALRLRARKR